MSESFYNFWQKRRFIGLNRFKIRTEENCIIIICYIDLNDLINLRPYIEKNINENFKK